MTSLDGGEFTSSIELLVDSQVHVLAACVHLDEVVRACHHLSLHLLCGPKVVALTQLLLSVTSVLVRERDCGSISWTIATKSSD